MSSTSECIDTVSGVDGSRVVRACCEAQSGGSIDGERLSCRVLSLVPSYPRSFPLSNLSLFPEFP